jgi:tRNA A-37 threonylcarbamoyl transferase component Bud32
MSLKIRYLNSAVQSRDLPELCNDPDGALDKAHVQIKSDKTTTLGRVHSDVGELVIKRYNTKNRWHMIRRNFQTSRARNSLEMSHCFTEIGIQVAEPMAVIEFRFGPFRGRSWFVSRYLDKEMLLDYLGQPRNADVLERIRSEISSLFGKLLKNRLSHGDMKATNILVMDNDLLVIDLDASRKHRIDLFHKKALGRDRKRFLKNWRSDPGVLKMFADSLDAQGIGE